MNAIQLVTPAQYFLDIGQESLTAFNGTAGLELPLSRQPDGRLTEACKQDLVLQLQKFFDRKPWQPRARVICAICARGVSLRRLSLPVSGKEDLNRLLPLQIEREFPLPPDQLAWGAQSLNGTKSQTDGSGPRRELLVAAVKKDNLEDYASIISDSGGTALFTLAALARSYLCPQEPGLYAVLSVGRTSSELITIDGGVPVAVRVLAWGLEQFAGRQGNSPMDAAAQVPQSSPHEAAATFRGIAVAASVRPISDGLSPLVSMINGQALGRKVFVTGIGSLNADTNFAGQLTQRIGGGVECQPVDVPPGAAASEAILGLQRVLDRQGSQPPLVLQLKQTDKKTRIAPEATLKLAGLGVGLALLALVLPFFEALALKSHLAHKLEAMKPETARFATIDRELDFLQYLEQSEPPYVDALLVLAKAAPPGTRFDSVSMNRRGEVSLRGSLQNGQQVAELRSKLIDSGFFASVGIEDQSPTPDRQKVTVRMSAQWKSADLRKAPPPEPLKASTNAKTSTASAIPPAVGPQESPTPRQNPLTPRIKPN